MIYGYHGKIGRVDLSSRKIEIEDLDESTIKNYIGGAGYSAKLLFDLTSGVTDPLGPENPLIFMTGPFTGTTAPTSGRHSVVSKSPLTGILGESDIGGNWGRALKGAGFDGLIIEGESEHPVYLHVRDGRIDFKAARCLWGKDTYEVDDMIKQELHPEVTITSIGPAGENLVRISGIFSDGIHGRTAARCGLGAVMGSKKLKAIVAEGNHKVPTFNAQGLQNSIKKTIPELREVTKALTEFGTAGGMIGAESTGDLPIMNWRLGKWEEGAKKLSGQAMRESFFVKQYRCHACPIGCGRTVTLDQGKTLGSAPEYETLGALGSMCLIDDLLTVSKANEICNQGGLDTISAGAVIAFAMEAYEKGLIPSSVVKGLDLHWGSTQGLFQLIHQMIHGEGLGKILGEGVKRASDYLGEETKGFALEVKGLEPPMHDPRAYNSSAVAYATSPFGASHWAGTHMVESKLVMPEIGYPQPMNRFENKGKGIMTSKMQDVLAMFNSLKVCKFIYRLKLQSLREWLNYTTGWDIGLSDFLKIGERVNNLKRLYIYRCGMKKKDDRLPDRLLKEKRGEGGAADNLPDLEVMLKEYYEFREWDERGLPKINKVEELDLLEEYRKTVTSLQDDMEKR
jgi:aldehyde:ferredoxin oxidoreductase